MVDKTKRALAVLQERSLRDREELSLWMRRQAEGMDQDLKKRSSDMMSHTLRQTEDRVADVRRRAGKFMLMVRNWGKGLFSCFTYFTCIANITQALISQ